jgi:hypothetical protein
MQIVEIPGVGEVEFPDSMSDAEVAAAAKRLHRGAGVADLGRKVKAKYPGAYDDMPDDAVGRAVKAKYPGAYDDFTDGGPPLLASHATPARKRLAPEEAAALGLPPAPRKRLSPEEADALGLPPAPGQTGMAESGVRGALQGASFGFADEAAAAVDAALPSWLRNETSARAVAPGLSDVVTGSTGDTYGDRYRRAREFYRNRNAAAEASNPGTYLAGELTGAVAAPGGAVRGLGRAVGQGAAWGLGYSDADLTRGEVGDVATDMATGAAFGVAGHGAGKILRRGLGRLAARGAAREATATARAGAQASGEVAEQLASARGGLGAEVQKGSRYVENLMRLEGSMTPEQRALYAQLEASGVVPNLQRAVAGGTLERLPGQASTIAAKQAELAALQAAAPAAVMERTRALLTPQVRADARSLFKSYGEPVIAATLGYKAADLAGADPETKAGAAAVAGLLGGRTRAGKALRTRITRPAHQAALGRAEQRIAESKVVDALVEALRRGMPMVATDAAVSGD